MNLKSVDRRRNGVLSVTTLALVLILTSLTGPGSVAAAADPPVVIELPAGTACPDFALRIEIRGGNQVVKEFTDRNGNVVRTLTAGKGSALSFMNLSSGATFSLKANGAVTNTRLNPDGSSTASTQDTTFSFSFRQTFLPDPRRRCTWGVSFLPSTPMESSRCNRSAERRRTSAPSCRRDHPLLRFARSRPVIDQPRLPLRLPTNTATTVTR